MSRSAESNDRDVEFAALKERLREAEDTLHAIQSGDVDAVMVSGDHGQQIYTLTNADRPYRVLIEQMREGAVTLSRDGIVVFCNDSFASLVGLAPERIVGEVFRALLNASAQTAFGVLFDREKGGSMECELAAYPVDVPVTVSLSPIPDLIEGRLVCGTVTDRREQLKRDSDLSEAALRLDQQIEGRTQAEAQLHQSQKMEIVGQLTGGLAHDFNNLLMVIGGNLDLIRRRVADETVLTRIGHMKSAVDRGAKLSQQLLAFSRKQSLNPAPVCVNDLLPEIEMLVRQAAGGHINVEMRHGDDLWHCRADENQLGSALLNLVINARDAMPDGGTIGIATCNVNLAEKDIHPGFEAMPGRFVRLSVDDSGTGMDTDVLSHVFEPFFTTKDVGKGTGLGLSQVYGFVRQSGGQVVIKSAVGRGTTVQLFLPWCGTPEASLPITESIPVTEPAERPKILVVEDDDEVRELTAHIAGGLGFPISEARSGPEALSVLARDPDIKLLLSDIIMPDGMNGFELAAEVYRRYPGMAIVLTSGFVGHIPRYDLMPNRNYEIVRKPFTEADLSHAIAKALRPAV